MDDAIKEGETPASPNWRDGLEPRIRKHVRFCESYAADHNHGAPGHLDYLTVAALAQLLDGAEITHTVDYTVTLDITGVPEIQSRLAALMAMHGGGL